MPRLHKYTAFPACDDCRSVNNLHLTISGSVENLAAQLQCAACRAKPTGAVDTSIPVMLLSRPILSRLFQVKPVAQNGRNVTQFEASLLAEFESKWEALRKRRRASQTSRFDPRSNDGLKLRP